jgi:hypothetical protein
MRSTACSRQSWTLPSGTVFLGSPSSAVRLRQYDKAAELRAKFARNPVKLAEVPENLTRLEVQVRPVGLAIRRACASQPPLAFLGVSAWTREIWREIEGQELQPLQVTKAWRQSDDDRTYDYLLDKFGPLLLRKIEEHGSAHCFALQLQHDLAERQAAKRRRH